MALIQDWLPPSRENWELVCHVWQFFPLITIAQWILDWYPQGKTSIISIFNLPGKWAWITMEAPGFLTLLYIMNTLPRELNLTELPWQNWLMGGLFVTHYTYRAIIFPLINPSMSPSHIFVWGMALSFQLFNAVSFGGWLAGYGPTTASDWEGRLPSIVIGVIIWASGLLSNIYYDDELREIRRVSARKQRKLAEEEAKRTGKSVEEVKANVDKVYMIPQAGLFQWIFYPHYFTEWVEWAGFWVIGGWNCAPARMFLINEVTTMLPRAVQGKRWYVRKFGAAEVGNRKAAIPGII